MFSIVSYIALEIIQMSLFLAKSHVSNGDIHVAECLYLTHYRILDLSIQHCYNCETVIRLPKSFSESNLYI